MFEIFHEDIANHYFRMSTLSSPMNYSIILLLNPLSSQVELEKQKCQNFIFISIIINIPLSNVSIVNNCDFGLDPNSLIA
jgi:hypothetical protein